VSFASNREKHASQRPVPAFGTVSRLSLRNRRVRLNRQKSGPIAVRVFSKDFSISQTKILGETSHSRSRRLHPTWQPLMGQETDDRALLAAIGRGDMRAFEQVYRRYKDDVYTMAVYLLEGDCVTAEDVLQDVMLALARRAGDLQVSTNLKSYLFTGCLNRVRDMWRRNRFVESPQASPAALDTKTPNPYVSAALAEQVARLSHALAQLPMEQREVVTLYVYGQMTFREIAHSLQISINTIKSRYRYALSGLRATLAENEINEANR